MQFLAPQMTKTGILQLKSPEDLMQATAKIHSKGKLQLIHVKSIETRLLYIMLAFFRAF